MKKVLPPLRVSLIQVLAGVVVSTTRMSLVRTAGKPLADQLQQPDRRRLGRVIGFAPRGLETLGERRIVGRKLNPLKI